MALSLRTLRELPPTVGAVVFRVDPLRAAATTLVVAALFVAALCLGARGGVGFQRGGVPGWVAWWSAAWLALFGLLAANDLRKALARNAWLALAGVDGRLEQVARRGDVITLVQLLRRREGLALAEAKQRAEAMIQRG